ncbi:MAG: HmuY family protein [Bacteroidales bacterium]|nr:HmuY family protein [Bacteroidales bacterium]
MRILLFLLGGVLLASCFEEDVPVDPYPGDVTTIENNISEYYSYFDFETGRVIHTHKFDDWDLGFACGKNDWHVRVNSPKGLFIAPTESQDILTVDFSFPVTGWKFDKPSGNPDSSAVGKWVDNSGDLYNYSNTVYLLGEKTDVSYQPLFALQFIFVDSTRYQFISKDFFTSLIDTITILKTDSANFTFYNFKLKSQLNLEPEKQKYDLIFQIYYEMLYTDDGIPTPYPVRGVFLNPNAVEAALDTLDSFDEIREDNISTYQFSNKADIIGYDWKDVTVDFDAGSAVYFIVQGRTYIIRSVEGNYYKLKFLSYTFNGINGYPRFEFKQI